MSSPALREQALAAALGRSEPLTGLLQRVHQSRQRFQALTDLLPEGLRSGSRPGPLDDTSWVLLVANAAAAAKVRQMLPQMQERLLAAGWPAREIKIKVRPPQER